MASPILIDTKTAAYLAGRPEATIRWWAHKGWITKHGTGRGNVRYDATEVPAAIRCDTTGTLLEPAPPPTP